MKYFGLALTGLAMLASTGFANGAYCGTPTDILAVQNTAIAKFNAGASKKIDTTYVMAAVIVQKRYAEADIEYAGQMSYYLKKSKAGRWLVVGTSPPANWPGSVTKQLTTLFNQRLQGSKACTNPHFVPRASGR
ncbi:MAG TPA: hypothetical protein VGR69_09035 [Candidatus Rubrimentiphilum sp.]|nr:hypothetical protein [Candidatus Rubrimentiphilum sp.]